MRDYNRVLDKGGLGSLLQDLAEKQPGKYRQVSKALSDVGYEAAYTTGGNSFGLASLRPSLALRQLRRTMNKEIESINNDQQLTDEQKRVIQVEMGIDPRQTNLVHGVINGVLGQEARARSEVRIEADDDPRARFLDWQRANYRRLAQLFIVDHDDDFEAFSWQMYAEAKEESCAS